MEIMKNIVLAAVESEVAQTPPPDWMVVVMGVGVVFIGLVLIIVLCKIMGLFFMGETKPVETVVTPVKAAPVANNTAIENRGEIIAAVTAACAEEMGKDVSAIRVISFKKI